MFTTRRIHVEETYQLRHEILRPHQALEQCQYPGDTDETTAHFGAFLSERIIGILSIYRVNSPKLAIPNGWQLRAMAVAEEARGKGYALVLLRVAENYASSMGGGYIWANARKIALGFYQNAGYEIRGDEFDIPDIGPHFLVCKEIA